MKPEGAKFYKVQLVRRGPYVPLMVWYGPPRDPLTGELLERAWQWRAARNGHHVDIEQVMIEWQPGGIPLIFGDAIDEAEYDYLNDLNAWARKHDPDAPEASPRDPIDLNKLPPLF